MLKKIFSFVMIFSIFTVNSYAVSQSGLKTAFDELSYSLTVEWDQKDKEFYTAQMKEFSKTIRGLQAQGLTNSQLIEFVKSEVKDTKVARDLETAFNMISINKMSGEEASKYMVETMKKSYSSGASWNGEVFVYLALGLLVVAVAVAVANGNVFVSAGGGGAYYCVDRYVCDTYCYQDWYYGYVCYDECYWVCY